MYVRGGNVRQLGYEQFTSDFIFVGLAVLISKLFVQGGNLPIVLMGALHAIGMLAALARLLHGLSPGWLRCLAGINAVLILTDVGYVAYFNSFFAEAASGIFALWTAAEIVKAANTGDVGWPLVIASVLLVCAKAQNAPLAVPLAIILLAIGKRHRLGTKAAAGLVVLAAGGIQLLSLGARPKLETSYNMLFSSVLPESRDPRGDLRALGLDPELVKFKGTLAWSPDSGLSSASVREVMKSAGPAKIVEFYCLRPTRLWRHITVLIPLATHLRPEACGNFTVSANHPPGARATAYSRWSRFHESWGLVGKPILFLLVGLLAATAFTWKRYTYSPVLWALSVLCLTAFMTAAFGDANEPIKHQYLFNLLLDMTGVGTVAACAGLAKSGLVSEVYSRTLGVRDPESANGITDEYPIMRHLCNLETVKTYEGTDHIHALIIGERVTGIAAYS